MVRVLSVNDVSFIPGTVIIVEVTPAWEPDKLNPQRKIYHFRTGYSVAGRFEDGKWTREKRLAFSTTHEFWSWVNFVRQSDKPVWIFGGNIRRTLTLLGFWDLLTDGEYTINKPAHPSAVTCKDPKTKIRLQRVQKGLLVDANGSTSVICFHRTRFRLTIVDTANYLDRSHDELSAMMGHPLIGEPDNQTDNDTAETICQQRCEVQSEFVRRLLTWHAHQEFGRFALSIAGTAFAAFRHRFMRDTIELPEKQHERDFQRAAYYSGQVETLWIGTVKDNRFTPAPFHRKSSTLFDGSPRGPFHLIDARSFYAAVCTFCELPIACVESHLEAFPKPMPRDESSIECIAAVTINSTHDAFPTRIKDRFAMATGEFTTTLAGPELQRAVLRGVVIKTHAWQRYRLSQPLRWYAEGLWKQRMLAESEGDQVKSALCKAMMARLHGKFLQRNQKWSLLPGRTHPIAWDHWYQIDATTRKHREFRTIGYDVQIKDDGGDAKYAFPALAAFVTAHGREWLRHWVRVAGERHVLYVSTDSLIVDDVGLQTMTERGFIYPTGVGSLRVVHSSADIEIRGVNNYTMGDHQVISGRPSSVVRVADGKFSAELWPSLESVFSSGQLKSVSTHTETGYMDRFTCIGEIGDGGWVVRPRINKALAECET